MGRTVKNTIGAAGLLRGLSVRLLFFRRDSQHYRRSKAQHAKSTVNHRAHWHPCPGTPRPPQNLHPCRGLALVGRCGSETVRPGQKADGKTRGIRKADCAFLEREARRVRGPVNTIGKVGRRIAARPSIYVGFASPAFGCANTIGEVGCRPAARPSIYVGFASSALGFANAIGEVGRRIAIPVVIYVGCASSAV